MLGVIGDLHFQEYLAYSEYISDRRKKEENEVLDTIVSSLAPCDKIVFMGDLLNGKSNTSEVNRKLIAFLERFNDKKLFIISGNHEKISKGKTSLDFLKEIKGHDWHIVTDDLVSIGDYDFLPYLINPELEAKDKVEASKALEKKLTKNRILFCHHSISDCLAVSGCETSTFDEAILSRKTLAKKYDLVVGGHIHKAQYSKNVIVAGSIFNNEVGEQGKVVWKIDEKTLKVEEIPLPGRGIYKLENPDKAKLNKLPKDSIVKVILSDKKIDKEETIKSLKKFSAYLLLEQYPNERKKIVSGDNLLEFDIEKMLEVYAKQKKINIKKLKLAWKEVK